MDLDAIRRKTTRYGIGLMSGTSCDGIDAALVRIKGTGPNLIIKLEEFATIPYAAGLRNRLLSTRFDTHALAQLNFELGEEFAQAASELVTIAQEKMFEVDFIASHGHTIAHVPPRSAKGGGTLQIAESAIIAERTGLPVVSNFRPRDMAASGQGAPLVPYADWVLFKREDRTVACLNIGGIANMTVVPPEIENVLAFDTGPGNMIIDDAARLLTRGTLQMDENGEAASRGVVIDEFLEYLLDHPYFTLVPPKSTGREEFGAEVYLRDALASRRDHSFEDLIATVTSAVAYSIVRAYNRFVKPRYGVSRVIVSGGGAKNLTLMERLRQGFGGIVVRTSDDYGIPSDAREALAFAILGNETICGTPSNIPQATGARRQVVLGDITPA
jgi:anhydro-N-acetylmuramic acid kinase